MGRVLVIGASGYVGSHLVERLLREGAVVRASARRREVLEARRWRGVEIVAADALRPETLPPALRGIDVAYYLVHSMGAGGDFSARDREAARSFATAAAEAGVRRIVYLGGLAGDSVHLASREETGHVLREGQVPFTEIRAGLIVGPGSAGFEVLRDLTNHLPVMIAPRWLRSRTRPIALDDVLSYLIRLATVPEAAGAILDIGGPETLTYTDLLLQYAEVTGRRRPLLIPVPVLTPRLSSYWLDLVTSAPANVVRPLLEGLRHDLIPDDEAARRLAPFPLKTYREAVAAALRAEREAPLAARWAEGALAFRGFNPDVSFYSKGEETRTPVNASASLAWQQVRSIGGRRGYFHANSLWTLRGLMDRAVGGPGMRRGRRHRTDIRVGDAIDFWRVAGIEEGRRLTLVAEMKLPGSAVLEFEVVPTSESTCEIITTARFHPAGMPGLLYWYAVAPLHGLIFHGMPRGMARAAERAAARRANPR